MVSFMLDTMWFIAFMSSAVSSLPWQSMKTVKSPAEILLATSTQERIGRAMAEVLGILFKDEKFLSCLAAEKTADAPARP